MGIKGIYKEIGPGERVSLCKLTTEHFEKHQRPLRLAIDISIWQFQIQAGKGGSNPAIRTLFYRLARLLGSAIEPIFVFDGPHKPVFKRNKRSGRGDGVATAMAKRLIRLFGFAIHDAPGEAEAECALLQRKGIVDAVLSEDVDTIMFGCGKMLRNWSAEGTKSKSPTHVTIYDAEKGISGLNREGMVLVALMSGGDYLPEGVPGCGVKVACEAARAGFGEDLCQIKGSDTAALASWKERLLEELRTNKSKHFRTKHRALAIPEDFPNLEVLRYYTHPVVSREENLDKIGQKFHAPREVDIVGLREFVAETFDWTNKTGAIKFIRVVSAQILAQRLVRRCGTADVDEGDLDLKQEREAAFVKSVTKRREHFSTDATPELRISYIPVDIIGIDLDAEAEDEADDYGRQGLALNSDDEFGGDAEEDGEQTKGGGRNSFDPLKPDLIWVPESILEMSLPLTVENWKDKQRAKELKATAPKAKRMATRSKKTDMPAGALDRFVKITKSTGSTKATLSQEPVRNTLLSEPPSSPVSSAPPITASKVLAAPVLIRAPLRTTASKGPLASGKGKQVKASSKARAKPTRPSAQVNPWTIASSQASPKVSKSNPPSIVPQTNSQQDPILLSSSPLAPSPSSSHGRSIEPTIQGTPTKRGKRLSSPSIDNSNERDPAGSAGIAATQQQTSPSSAYTSPEPIRQARPFIRTKSGAEDEMPQSSAFEAKTSKSGTQTSIKGMQASPKASTQTSIKAFGRISRNSNPVPSLATKALVIPLDPFTSDEEDGDGVDIPLPPSPRGPLRVEGGMGSFLPLDDKFDLRGGHISDNDDPFAPLPSSEAPTLSRPLRNLTAGERRGLRKGSSEPLTESEITSGASKILISCTGGKETGFVSEVVVPCKTLPCVLGGSGVGKVGSNTSFGVRSGGKTWRVSDVSVIDLTGED
ncbi:hypothetical protein B0T14DRAFT_534986 [Immersiella caudata]|uniref:Flap structure-specific endonuclease n=1 Tax=Immersiella caudata TaxID=314043 RepID=A0AA39X4E5_9PEZI|nr:hypothetical protein B0T14DRAFT_534986 [Immersiella caudata]